MIFSLGTELHILPQDTMNQLLIQFVKVYKKIGDSQVLNGVDLSIFQGEITTIIGESGSGKSVLLKHIIGLIKPDAGEILFYGRRLSEMKPTELNELKEKFSYVFQDTALFDSVTVYDNIALPLREGTSLPESEIKRRVEDKIQLFDLKGVEDKYPSQLSGGTKRRVALARALVTNPEVVLFDEPTTGLDPIRKNSVHSMILDYQKRFGFTAVMISHDIPNIFFFSQRVVMLDDGKIRFEGTPEEIRRSTDPVVLQFVHGRATPQDELTGMATQLQGERRYIQELARLHQHRIVFSIIILTVENLDEINERMGHIVGQTVLKDFADEVRQRLEPNDFCCRYSLNKILVILPNTDIEEARRFSSKLAEEVKATQVLKKEVLPLLAIKIGAGFAEAEVESPMQEVIARAESHDSYYYVFSLS